MTHTDLKEGIKTDEKESEVTVKYRRMKMTYKITIFRSSESGTEGREDFDIIEGTIRVDTRTNVVRSN